MDPLKIEELFGRVQKELKTVGSERVQLFCIYEFLEALDGQYDEYESYMIQVMSSFPSLRNPLLFTGLRPSFLTDIIVECELVVRTIPSLSNDKELLKKLDYLKTGLFHINNWLGIRGEESGHVNLTSISDTGFVEGDIKDKSGEVFIPVVENSGLFPQKGRLRKLKVQLVGKSRKGEFELRPVFGVIGANAGDIGNISAQVAGNLLKESVGKSRHWIGTASFELSHTWHAGSSANLALAGLYYCEMLKAENRREYFQLNPGIAITGDIDKHGNVLEVDTETLKQKTDAAFFSWAQVLVVPVKQLEHVQVCLEELEREFPNRNLIVKGIGNLRELYYDRRLALHKETSLIKHTAKEVWQKRNTAMITVIVVILLAIIGRLSYGPIDKNITYAELVGNRIQFKNSVGFEVVSFQFDERNRNQLEENLGLQKLYKFKDITGDGINEIFWGDSVNLNSEDIGSFKAWSVTGDSLIWEQEIDVTMDFPRQQGLNQMYFFINELEFAEGRSGKDYLIVVADAGQNFPGVIIKVEMNTGKIISYYTHVGNLSEIEAIDLNNDGKDEIIATGINNAFWMASIVVLDIENIQGHSPTRGDYILDNMPKANEIGYILVPKSIVGSVYDDVYKYSRGDRIYNRTEQNRFVVSIYDLPNTIFRELDVSGRLYYSFDYSLVVQSILSSDYYDIVANDLYEDGLIPFVPDYDYWETFKDSLLWWNGEEFVHEPVINRENMEGLEK